MAIRCWHCHHIKEGIIRYRIVVCSQLPSGTTSKKKISSWCLSPYWCWRRELALFAWCWSPFVSRCETTEFFLAFFFKACLARLSSQSAWPHFFRLFDFESILCSWTVPTLRCLRCGYLTTGTKHHGFSGRLGSLGTMASGQGPRVHHTLTNFQCSEFILILYYIMIYHDILYDILYHIWYIMIL